jgi:hypothetical protein
MMETECMAGLQDSFHADVSLLATFRLMLEYVLRVQKCNGFVHLILI